MGFVSTNPFPLRIVDNAQPPDVILERDSVDQGNTINVTSIKDGMLYLVIAGTPPNLTSIFYSFFFVDSSTAIANIPVEFPTVDLGVKDYWLYAVDIYGFISVPDTVTLVPGVGVKEITMAGICVYPNPSNTFIIIETDISDVYHINITSLNGQLIYNNRWDGASHQIDLSLFQKGVYFITIRSKDFVTTKKIIKL